LPGGVRAVATGAGISIGAEAISGSLVPDTDDRALVRAGD
jgi:hypothetical protein